MTRFFCASGILGAWVFIVIGAPAKAQEPPATQPAAVEKMLFDFEDEADLKTWTPTDLQEAGEAAKKAFTEKSAKAATDPATAPKYRAPASKPPPEPPVKLEFSSENATRGKHCLKLTYGGGSLPTVGTDVSWDDWSKYNTFLADVTASRQCVVIFRVMFEKSAYGNLSFEAKTGRYEKVARLEAGRNHAVELAYDYFKKQGKVVRFEITMYAPNPGESIYVDNIRFSTELPKATSPFSYRNLVYMGEVRADTSFYPRLDRKIKVLGTDWELDSVNEIGRKLKDAWVKPQKKTVEQVETEWKAAYEELKKTHPKAVTAIFRDGEKGCDLAHPDKVYDGWRDTELQGHDPASIYASVILTHPGKTNESEMFLRRRCFLMKADLSSIPKGSEILLARFMVVKTVSPNPNPKPGNDQWSPLKPAFFVAEPCMRDWDEEVANGIEYAKGKFWKEICGQYWIGDDPDFLPMVIAYGQAGYDQNVFDFTQAVNLWLNGKQPNYGFLMYSPLQYMEFCKVWMRHVPDIKNRPAMMVIYEPKEK